MPWRDRLSALRNVPPVLRILWESSGTAVTWGIALRLLCFAAGLIVGGAVAARPRPINLLSGILGSSLLFYFVTNSAAWKADPFYAPTLAGWWQALTVGHPEFAPTIFFFRFHTHSP